MKLFKLLLLTLLICVFSLPAFAFQSIAPSAGKLKEMNVLLIDIREPFEWAETGIVEGAIPITASRNFLQDIAPYLDDRPVALICRTGNRTSQLARMLEPHLTQDVIHIEGGIFRLISEGYQPIPCDDC